MKTRFELASRFRDIVANPQLWDRTVTDRTAILQDLEQAAAYLEKDNLESVLPEYLVVQLGETLSVANFLVVKRLADALVPTYRKFATAVSEPAAEALYSALMVLPPPVKPPVRSPSPVRTDRKVRDDPPPPNRPSPEGLLADEPVEDD